MKKLMLILCVIPLLALVGCGVTNDLSAKHDNPFPEETLAFYKVRLEDEGITREQREIMELRVKQLEWQIEEAK